MRKSYLPLLAVLVVVAAACSSDASEQIEGTWLTSANGVYVEFGDDGQFKVADNEALSDPFEWGDYTFDGETLTIGVTFVINTDSHHPSELGRMEYGVLYAQRGWVEAAMVANTWPTTRFLKWVAKKRG